MPFSAIIQFFRVPLNVLVRTPGGTRIPGWKSLLHSFLRMSRLLVNLFLRISLNSALGGGEWSV